jgi:GNAT superfamily N-acetyltransferase
MKHPSPLAKAAAVTLRSPQPGDMGWVVQQHAEIYAREYGLDSRFEALVAEIVAKFLRKFQPEWERCWIAEVNGVRAGSVFVVRQSQTAAKLRLLILTPEARGLGLGGRLTDECIAFARGKGYKKMVLWTQSELHAARAIYAGRGFRLVGSESHHDFGPEQVGEMWEMAL